MKSTRKSLRVVVDTNLFVSGLILKTGNPFELLEAWRARLFNLLLCHEQRAEIEAVLRRPKIQEKYNLSSREIGFLLRLLEAEAFRAPLRRRLPVKLRDPKDEMILASALGGKADFLVTGDDDLLVLRENSQLVDLEIVTAREFLSILAKG